MNLLLLPQKEKNSPFKRGIASEMRRKPFFKRSRNVCIIQEVPDGGLMDVGLCLQSRCSNIFFGWTLSFITLELKALPMTLCQNL